MIEDDPTIQRAFDFCHYQILSDIQNPKRNQSTNETDEQEFE